jgi:protease-4
MLQRIFCVISGLFLLISQPPALADVKPPGKTVVAVFDLNGTMTEQPADDSPFAFGDQGVWLRDVVTRMNRAANDPDVKAVLVLGDGASVGLAQAAEVNQAMQAVRAAGKDVYAHADSMMMGQYVLLGGASRLSMAPTGDLWAVGLYGDQIYLHGLLVKLGIQPDFLHCGAYKSASEIFMRDGPSPEADAMTNWLLDSIYDTVVKSIAAERHVSTDRAKTWLDQGPYTSEKAKANGMIDAIEDRAGLESALKDKYGKDVVFDKRHGHAKQPDMNFSNPFAMMSVLAQMMGAKNTEASGKPAVGVVYVDGMIMLGKADSGLMGGQFATSTDIASALDQAADDDSVKAVILRVDSPGGSATASEIILHATERVKAKKPLVVSMGGVAGSGGYYVACAADNIFADDATITASIGVVGGKLVTTGMWNNVGVTFKAYQRGAHAGLLSTDTDFSDSERAKMQSWMEDIYGVFKNHVTAIRGNRLKKPIDELDAGRVFTGRQALDLGLVDKIGSLQDAIVFAADQAHLKDYDVRTVPEPKNFLQRLMEQASDGDSDRQHVALGADSDWLFRLAEPYLTGLDAQHIRIVQLAFRQLQLVQQERVMLMLPPEYCGGWR